MVTRIDLRSEKTEYLTNDEIMNFFEPSLQMNEIMRVRNTYIIGHKGSGKSFILKYLSVPLQVLRINSNATIEFDKKAIGLLMQCNTRMFGGLNEDPDETTPSRSWSRMFIHAFNLSALYITLKEMYILYTQTSVIEEQAFNSFVENILKAIRIWSDGMSYDQALIAIDQQLRILEDVHCGDDIMPKSIHLSNHTFLFDLQKYFCEYFHLEPVFLLDEYNELSSGQQKAINEMIRLRLPAFKMSTLPKSYVVERLKSEEQNDIDQDYSLVHLGNGPITPNSPELPAIQDFLSNVWKKRIKNNASRNITDVLEMPQPLDEINKTTQKSREYAYCGFSNYAIISSGNPKTFLDLIQLTFDKAETKQIDILKHSIPLSLQLESISEYSRERRREIIQSDSTYGRSLMKLVEHVGKYLRLKSKKTHDAYRSFSIYDGESIDDLSYKTIEIGLKKSWIMQNNLYKVSKHQPVRLEIMTLNNVLLPSFDIPLAEHQVWQITKAKIREILDPSDIVSDQSSLPQNIDNKKENKQITIEEYRYADVLQELIKNNKLLIFVGSGLSSYVGMPSVEDLYNMLVKKIELDDDTVALPLVAQYYENLFGRDALISLIKSKFDSVMKSKLNIYNDLFKCKSKIITTNWDDLLEKNSIEHCQVIVTKDDLTKYNDAKLGIFKIHGDLNHPTLMVITEKDYANYDKTHAFMKTKLKALLQNHSILFVGYSITDPNFTQLRNLVKDELGSILQSYAVLPGISPLHKDNLEMNNILVIDLDLKFLFKALLR